MRDVLNKYSFSRREVLKVLGIGSLGAGLLYWKRRIPDIIKLWKDSGSLATGEVLRLGDIANEIPPQLKNKNIPENNENFKPAVNLLIEGMTIYKEWQKANPDMYNLNYARPDNYVDMAFMAKNVAKQIPTIPDRLSDTWWGVGLLLDAFQVAGKPYEEIADGSGGGIEDYESMVRIDPGSGFINRLRVNMKDKFGANFDVWNACNDFSVSDDQKQFIKKEFHSWYNNAESYVQQLYKKSGEKLSTSYLFAYFLHSNNGNILRSLWDTTLWLKVTARNRLVDLAYDPNYDRAKTILELFKDEFSPQISANWVIENVSPDDTDLNTADKYLHAEWKTFMPINRAGIYHDWNIIALCCVISPELVKRLVASNLNDYGSSDKYAYLSEYGRERILGDMLVVDQAEMIDKLINQYAFKH